MNRSVLTARAVRVWNRAVNPLTLIVSQRTKLSLEFGGTGRVVVVAETEKRDPVLSEGVGRLCCFFGGLWVHPWINPLGCTGTRCCASVRPH